MACSSIVLSGINTGCKDVMGGIKEVYMIKAENVTSVTLDTEGAAISAISCVSSAHWKTYKFRKGTSQLSSTMQTDEAAGTLSIQTDLELQFSKQETAKRLEIMALCMDEMCAIVKDNNDLCWYLGKDLPVTATAATGQSGTAFEDFGGYNITLTDNSRQFPFEVPASVIATLTIDPAPVA